jgi:hypothetical protein
MANVGDLQYKMECPICGRHLLVDSMSSKLPKHPMKGETITPYVPYVPCVGTGMLGLFVDTKIKGFD